MEKEQATTLPQVTPAKKDHRLLLIFLFLSFISLGATVVILQYKLGSSKQKQTDNEEVSTPVSDTPQVNPHQATLITDTVSDTATNIIISKQDFDLEDLNAYQLDISFNPQAIIITSVSPGEVWLQTNLLSNDIDNETGNISVSIGRGFDTQITNKTILSSIEYQVINPNLSPDFKILETSQLAITGYTTSPKITVE